jgi:hypothetical protein
VAPSVTDAVERRDPARPSPARCQDRCRSVSTVPTRACTTACAALHGSLRRDHEAPSSPLKRCGFHGPGQHDGHVFESSSSSPTSPHWCASHGVDIWEVFFLDRDRPGRVVRWRRRPNRTRTSATSWSTPRATASPCAPSRRRSFVASPPSDATLRMTRPDHVGSALYARLRERVVDAAGRAQRCRRARRAPRPATARGSSSSRPTATCTPRASCRCASATCASGPCPRSTAKPAAAPDSRCRLQRRVRTLHLRSDLWRITVASLRHVRRSVGVRPRLPVGGVGTPYAKRRLTATFEHVTARVHGWTTLSYWQGLRGPLSATGKSVPLMPAAMSLAQKLDVARLYSALKMALWPRKALSAEQVEY